MAHTAAGVQPASGGSVDGGARGAANSSSSSGVHRLVRTITVAADAAAQEAAAQTQAAVEGPEELAVSAVSDDEAALDEPADQRAMSMATHSAALQLMKGGQVKEAAALWDQVAESDPDKAEWHHMRGVARMRVGRHKEAVQDFTVCLALTDCSSTHRYQSLLFRGRVRELVGDLGGADSDYKQAVDAADDEPQRAAAKAARQDLTRERVKRKLAEAAKRKKQSQKPAVYHYSNATIEELEPEEGSEEHGEAVAHERAAAWQEEALKLASEARGRAARLTRELAAEQQRVREENQARAERNLVRQARRRSAAQTAAEQQRRRQQQQEQQQEQRRQQERRAGAAGPVLVERTKIPIHVVASRNGTADSSASSLRSSSGSSRSTASRQEGYCSGSESGAEERRAAAGGQEAPRQAAVEGPPAEKAAGTDASTLPALVAATKAAAVAHIAAEAVAEAAPASLQAKADTEAEEVRDMAATGAEAAAPERTGSASTLAPEPGPEVPSAAAQPSTPEAEPAAAAVSPSEGQAEAEAEAEAAAPLPLLSAAELDRLKQEADTLQRKGDAAGAEAAYLLHRPADLRAWSNRAENCCKVCGFSATAIPGTCPHTLCCLAGIDIDCDFSSHNLQRPCCVPTPQAQRWPSALECCNQGLSVSTPSHAVPRHKLLFRQARDTVFCLVSKPFAASPGTSFTTEALRSFEGADASAEAEGADSARKALARHIAEVLAEMDSKGIQPTAEEPAPASLNLPPLPVFAVPLPHEVPEESDLEGPPAQATPGEPASAAAGSASPAAAGTGTAGAGDAAAAAEGPAGKLASAVERDRGNACFKKRQWELALRHYEQASRLDPSCPLALANQAAALLKLRRWGAAEAAATQARSAALVLDSGCTKARYRRAHAYAGDNNPQMALVDMQIVADASPGDAAVQRELAAMREAVDSEAQAGFLGADTVNNNPLFSPAKRR
ncbi:Peptidyl-prolyl cis-trans isomerase D [Chlorella vulgaris]